MICLFIHATYISDLGTMSTATWHTDNERAVLNAIVDVFPQISRKLCVFHYMQNIMKRVFNSIYQ